jgi:zinc D-Ala-D-Ala dipeptidase
MRKTVVALLLLLGVGTAAAAEEVPAGFVWLKDIDPTIEQEMRYYGDHNFMGRTMAGYEAPECILTRQAAEALAAIQAELAQSRLSLKVYDCYRPQRAVDGFVAWSKDVPDQTMKAEFYPRIDKARVFELGYVAAKSGHTRGSTVDLTIVPMDHAIDRPFIPGEPLVDCALPANERFPDTTIDFGTGYDCMDEKSHHDRTDIPAVAQANRAMFKDIMERHGFVPVAEEWWHYSLKAEPFPDTYFDFPVVSPQMAK